jgi:hypothetical protein
LRFAATVVVGLVLVGLLPGCSNPSKRFDNRASDHGFLPGQVTGISFEHRFFASNWGKGGDVLHVYLGSDGTPWVGHWRIAEDPTPRRPLTLDLMNLDPQPSLFLGRPCYHGHSDQPPCDSSLWTSSRYSSRVVDSMTVALRSIVADSGFRDIVLIGYSGGGTLAMLMADRLDNARAVVTIAANLDLEGWIRYHGYTPLYDSLNPAQLPPLPPELVQIHLIGGRDRNVPPWVTRKGLRNQPHAQVLEFERSDHVTGWIEQWPDILDDLRGRLQPESAYPTQ